MHLVYRCPTAHELEALLPLLDKEFITSRGRQFSIRQRYTDVFDDNILGTARILCSENRILAFCVIKPAILNAEGKSWRVAMLGLVWVSPEIRSKGYGSEMIKHLNQQLNDQGFDFGVLWTSSHRFYEKIGWISSDIGVTCEYVFTGKRDIIYSDMQISESGIDIAAIERIRRRNCSCYVDRNELNYRKLPIPSKKLNFISVSAGSQYSGYAIVGVGDGIHYLYEFNTVNSKTDMLWLEIERRFSRIFINTHIDSELSNFLSKRECLEWKKQDKCMWLLISDASRLVDLSKWHISYFDWI